MRLIVCCCQAAFVGDAEGWIELRASGQIVEKKKKTAPKKWASFKPWKRWYVISNGLGINIFHVYCCLGGILSSLGYKLLIILAKDILG